jgi:hypothetical protein
MVRFSGDCIIIAATLRQTAAPAANMNSEIHMAGASLGYVLVLAWIVFINRG